MIAFVDQSGQLGGAELCLGDLARDWGAQGRVVLLSEGPFAAWLRERGVSVEVAPLPQALAGRTRAGGGGSPWQVLTALFRYRAALSAALRGADLLYLNTPKALLAGMVANLGTRRPTVFHLHDLLLPTHFNRVNLRLLVMAANRATAVIANSGATADAYRSAGGQAPVHVIPNGFDPSPFEAVTAQEVAALREELNPGGRPVVAIFGRLARWKGQAVLLRAAARLPEVIVWVVGDALFTGDDRAYAEELRQMADPERVRFLGFRNDIPALMKAADVVVHASTAPEPFGRVIVEGMLAARPVIATRGGGAEEILEGIGTLVPPGDDEVLAEALERLLKSAALREELGKRGEARARKRYALSTVLEQTRELLTPLLPQGTAILS